MTETSAHPKISWLRRHKWLTALAILAVAILAAVQVVEYFVNVDRYREQAESFVEDRTGMPVSIDRLELTLIPQPSVSAYAVVLGEGGLSVQCSEARVTAEWNGLFSRRVTVSEVTLYGLAASFPEELAKVQERIDIIQERSKKETSSKWKVSVESIRARSARISVAGISRPVFVGDILARDILTGSVPVEADGTLPFLGETARAAANVVMAIRKGGSPAVAPSGWVEVRGFDPRQAFEREAMPPLILEAKATFDAVTADAIGMKLEGQAAAAEGAPQLVQAAAGPFDGTLWIRGGEVTLNDFELTAPNLTVRADATRSPDGAFACELQSATVEGDALAAVYALVNTEGLELVPQKEAAVTASGLLFGVDAEGALRLVRGNIEFAGVQPTLASGSKPFGDIRGKVHLDEGVVLIDEITGTGLAIKGAVKPELERAGASVDLAADLTLSPEVVAAFVKKNDTVKELGGHIAFKRIAGTFEKGKPLPEDLQIDGTIDKGQARLAFAGLEETLTGISGRFEAQPDAISVKASCQSTLLGPLSTDARISPQKQRITGTVQADLARLNLPFPQDEASRNALMDFARAYGVSHFELDASLPTADTAEGAVRLARQESPALSAIIALGRKNDAMSVMSVDAAAAVPVSAARALLPAAMEVDGTAAVTVQLPMDQERFEAHLDLSEASLRFGDYVNKKPGDPAAADVLVARANQVWKPQTATLHYGGEDIVARFEQDRVASDFDLEVAALKNLFAENVRADGHVAGTLRTNPIDLELTLQDCALGLSEELRFDSINGRVAYADETPRLDNLAIRGLNSDFTLTVHQTPSGVWQGAVRGNQLDIDTLTAAAEGFSGKDKASAIDQPETAQGPPAKSRPSLDLQVQLANVLYRHAQVGDVRATVKGQNGVYDVQDFTMAPGSGTVTGTAKVQLATAPEPSSIAMDLALNEVDLSVVDGLAFAAPRGLKGATTGTLQLTAPFGGGINPTNGATGNVRFVSRNGTLGKLGIATKILTVMRTTEIIRLRMPSTKDEGIAFDTCEGKVTLDKGFMTINEFVLKSPTLAMTAQGTVDFPQDATDMLVDISLLQMATQVLDAVKLGDVADQIRKQSSYRLAVTGPPADPKVSVQGLTTAEGITGPVTDTARDAAKTGQQTVVDVLQGSANILRGILGAEGGQKKSPEEPKKDSQPK